jgi:hypothetical protein
MPSGSETKTDHPSRRWTGPLTTEIPASCRSATSVHRGGRHGEAQVVDPRFLVSRAAWNDVGMVEDVELLDADLHHRDPSTVRMRTGHAEQLESEGLIEAQGPVQVGDHETDVI